VKFTTDLSLFLWSYIFALPIRLDGAHGENFVSFADISYFNNKNTQIVVDCCYLCMNALRDILHNIKTLIFYVLLTVRLSIILVINQLNAQNLVL